MAAKFEAVLSSSANNETIRMFRGSMVAILSKECDSPVRNYLTTSAVLIHPKVARNSSEVFASTPRRIRPSVIGVLRRGHSREQEHPKEILSGFSLLCVYGFALFCVYSMQYGFHGPCIDTTIWLCSFRELYLLSPEARHNLSGCQMLKRFDKRIWIECRICLYEKSKYIIKFPQ